MQVLWVRGRVRASIRVRVSISSSIRVRVGVRVRVSGQHLVRHAPPIHDSIDGQDQLYTRVKPYVEG